MFYIVNIWETFLHSKSTKMKNIKQIILQSQIQNTKLLGVKMTKYRTKVTGSRAVSKKKN